jgi:CsoR family transcriptional regulator, copper-sensing transcriptional repressor
MMLALSWCQSDDRHSTFPLPADTNGALKMAAYEMQKPDIAKRLARIEGQVRGIAGMIESDRYCIDVLDQISAVTKGLQTVAVGLLHDHLGHCVTRAIEASGPDAHAKIDEAVASISRLMRS